MKLKINYNNEILIPTQNLSVGEMAIINESEYLGHVIIRTFDGFVSLSNPNTTWQKNFNIMCKKLNSGESVTLTQE